MQLLRSPRLVAGRYALERPVGRGGTATVWAARDLADGSVVALKWLRRADPRAALRAT